MCENQYSTSMIQMWCLLWCKWIVFTRLVFLMVVNNIDGMWYFTIDLQDGKLTFMDST